MQSPDVLFTEELLRGVRGLRRKQVNKQPGVTDSRGRRGVPYLGQHGWCGFTTTHENTADTNRLELREVLLFPQCYRCTVQSGQVSSSQSHTASVTCLEVGWWLSKAIYF